ncbi:MAG: HAD-IA family hydrolase [Erysipelothrix sp.]|nr:HAD-IA family hydrolase [Erysipelothrix sp.]
MIKGIIFDLDGTLLNSLNDLGNSVNKVLRAHGFEEHDMSSYKNFVGNGVYKLVERSFEKDYDNLEEAYQSFLMDYKDACTQDSHLYDGIYDLLKRLNALEIPIAIHTNKAQELTDKIVKHYMSDIDFVDVIGDRFDGLNKPNPFYTTHIANQMNLKPESILFVGDSDVDIINAKNGGFIPAGVSWGFRHEDELLENGAKHIINNAEEILKLL